MKKEQNIAGKISDNNIRSAIVNVILKDKTERSFIEMTKKELYDAVRS